jgi:hypothetical protein
LYGTLDRKAIVDSLVDALAGRSWPGDEEFLNAWVEFPIYSSGTAKCRHILESLEQAQSSNNEPVDITHARITIEHVMPQQLNEAWEAELGSNAADIHNRYLHTIGNLTLTGMNESMGNSSFAEKKKTFAGSGFALNKYFANPAQWNGTTIVERSKVLGELAVDIWRRPNTESKLKNADDPTGYKPTHFVLFGVTYTATTWTDVLVTTCAILAQRHGVQEFANLATQVKGTIRQYISDTKDEMITAAQIPGTGLWVEANQSSKTTLWVINQILERCGHTGTDFKAYW